MTGPTDGKSTWPDIASCEADQGIDIVTSLPFQSCTITSDQVDCWLPLFTFLVGMTEGPHVIILV